MFNNLTNLMFLSILIAGSIISISSNSWLGAWMGLEINLMAFIPLLTNLKNITSTESSLKYFIVQALASTTLLFVVLMMSFNENFDHNNFLKLILNSALLMKMGAAPFHTWFPEVMEGLSWAMGFVLMTWQKIAPMILLSYCLFHKFILFIIIISIFVGSTGGFNQTNLRSLMAYSSISHLGWMLSSLMISITYWFIYFMFYSILSLAVVAVFFHMNIFFFSQIFSYPCEPVFKFLMFGSFLSLGGLPPFTGFLPKWIIIQSLSMSNPGLVTIMVMLTLVTLFFYIRLAYSAFMLHSTHVSWNKAWKTNFPSFLVGMNFVSLFGLSSVSLIYVVI